MGHAARCVPIINALINANYQPVLASDGEALLLLQREFPLLKCYKLPSYHIKYAKNGKYLLLTLFFQIPSIIRAVKKEHCKVAQIAQKEGINGIISDNRFGVYHRSIPSVYITHQLQVLSGIFTFFSTRIHQKIINNFDVCWVPDIEKEPNFSGKLGHVKNFKMAVKYIGILSRFKVKETEIKYDLLVLLSGPEPQRTLLENKLLHQLKSFKGKVIFVRGIVSGSSEFKEMENIKIVDFLGSVDLEHVILQSKVILARSGYSTIMDLAMLGKKAFFIPTPGQFEQLYLAEIMQQNNMAPYEFQEKFRLDNLNEIHNFKGFEKVNATVDLDIFSLFEGK